MSCKRNSDQMSQCNFRKSCLINHTASEKDQQEKESECVRKSTDSQKIAQQKYYNDYQHREDKEAAEAEQQLTDSSEQKNTDQLKKIFSHDA